MNALQSNCRPIADQYNIDSPNSPDNVSSSDGAQDTVAPPIVDLAASGSCRGK